MTRLAAQKPRRRSPRRGFTLTEVLLVLAILGVIAAMVVPNLLGSQQKANIQATKNNIKAFEDACTQYAIAHDGEYPTGGRDEVIGLLTNPGVDKDGKSISPYLGRVPKDAWGEPLYYEFPNSKAPNAINPAIWSSGRDHKNDDGNNDDVNNWQQ